MINTFISYSNQNKLELESLNNWCMPLVHREKMKIVYDNDILRGADLWKDIIKKIHEAQVIILMISDSYLKSKNCNREMIKAMELRSNGKKIIAIILEECGWRKSMIKDLFIIDMNVYSDKDETWIEIVESIDRVLKKVKSRQESLDSCINIINANNINNTNAHIDIPPSLSVENLDLPDDFEKEFDNYLFLLEDKEIKILENKEIAEYIMAM